MFEFFDHKTESSSSGCSQYSAIGQKKKRPNQSSNSVGFFGLFRFADRTDLTLIIVGTIAALLLGCTLQAFIFVEGLVTDAFALSGEEMIQGVLRGCVKFAYIGIFALVMGWLMLACWVIAGERQSISCRKVYYESLLKQSISWFDLQNQSQMASRFSIDCAAFSNAIGEKPTVLFVTLGVVLSGFVIAFNVGWLLSLVVSVMIPAMILSFLFYSKIAYKEDKLFEKIYTKAAGTSEQALNSIKTVKSLNGEQFESQKYIKILKKATLLVIDHAKYYGLAVGLRFFFSFASYGLGFWYGSHCVQQTQVCNREISGQLYTAGRVQIIFNCMLMVGIYSSRVTPCIQKITMGQKAAHRIFSLIDTNPFKIRQPNSLLPGEDFKGEVKFHNVYFAYPRQPDQPILKNLNLEFNKSNSALVGKSGSGKSTIFQLLLRFYDPDEGVITLDGVDIKKIDPKWLRQHIGYVGQDSVLFSMTIKQNLLLGKSNATDSELSEALKAAEAYEFVESLEEKWDTHVGYAGSQLSGGQKQRITIARALLRNPKILLLDEATSALDRKNEKTIQQTIDRISVSRTTITIAHRVETIIKSDTIYVIDEGRVLQKGKFCELERFRGWKDEQQEQTLHLHGAHQSDANGQQNALNQHRNTVGLGSGFQNRLRDQKPYGQILNAPKRHHQPEENQMVFEGSGQYQQKEEDEDDEPEYGFWELFKRLTQLYSNVKLELLMAVLCSIVIGLSYPIFTIFLSKILVVLLEFQRGDVEAAYLREQSNWYSLLFVGIGVVALISYLMSAYFFLRIGAMVSEALKIETYQKILRMPISWFDRSSKTSGSLSVSYQMDCNNVKEFLTYFNLFVLENLSTIVAGMVIGLIYDWRVAIIAICMIPFMIFNGLIAVESQKGFLAKKQEIEKASSSLVSESVNNIRTIRSLGCEDQFLNLYDSAVDQQLTFVIRKGVQFGLLYGISQIITFACLGLAFYAGAVFINDGRSNTRDVFAAAYAVLLSAVTVGHNAYSMPEFATGRNSATNIFKILDSEDEDQKQVRQGSKFIRNHPIKGDIELRGITFKYQSRDEYIFNNFNLSIQKGRKVAFVGHSGCGKTTILQLLQRFYDPMEGQILIDGIDIRDFDLHFLRGIFGVVSQEAVLFNGSFRGNITYNRENVSEEELLKAIQLSNAYEFILGNEELKSEINQSQNNEDQSGKSDQNSESTDKTEIFSEEDGPQTGLNRNVGIRGSRISGGQKQRVAIARTILRNPQILLLDQATSALDSQNEKQVQESLDFMMRGRTTISVAHRISTIINSDEINVFQKGGIVERGNYGNLMKKKGHFYNLQKGIEFL